MIQFNYQGFKWVNIKKNLNLTSIQAVSIGLLILTFPYTTFNATVGTLTILSFLIMLFQRKFSIVEIFKEKVLVVLFIFILFTYISSLWSDVSFFDKNSDFHTSLDRFKYYFLLIPSIYFSNFSQETIKRLLWLIILAPLPVIIIYYLNSFGVIHYYYTSSKFISHYLVENIFILFSCIFLYIYSMIALQKRQIYKFIFLVISFFIAALSLFIDHKTDARIVDITLALLIPIGLLYIFKPKYIILPSIIIFVLGLFTLFNNPKIQEGLQTFQKAVTQHDYTGSWGHRTAYAIVGFDIFMKNPFFGSGINDISSEILQYKKTNPVYFRGEEQLTRLHNDHLLFLDQVGLIGYMMFVYFIYLLLRVRLSDQGLEIFKNLFIISFMLLMMAEHYLTNKYSTNLFAIVIALILLYKRRDRLKIQQELENNI